MFFWSSVLLAPGKLVSHNNRGKEMKTMQVELFIHKTATGEASVSTADMSEFGWMLLGRKTITVNVPEVDEVAAEIEALAAQENKIIEDANKKTFEIREQIKTLRGQRNAR